MLFGPRRPQLPPPSSPGGRRSAAVRCPVVRNRHLPRAEAVREAWVYPIEPGPWEECVYPIAPGP